jgi:energy-coupling factor transport system substrate-specific component
MAFAPGEPALTNVGHYAAFYVTTSFGWDCVRALVNATLVLLAGRPVLATLRRAARRAAWDQPPSSAPVAPAPDQVDGSRSPGPTSRLTSP